MKRGFEINKIVVPVAFCCSILLSACSWNGSYSDKAFLSGRYVLAQAMDIKGQDINAYVRYYDYKDAKYYTEHFLIDPSESFIEFRVYINESGHAEGRGHISFFDSNKSMLAQNDFIYYCTSRENNYEGDVISQDVGDSFGKFIYCWYWCRVMYAFTLPGSSSVVNLMLQFNFQKSLPYPEEFQPQ